MPRILYAGADLRERTDRHDDHWSADRRARYLLRPDVARPLSVDRSVWGTVAGHEDPPLPWIGVDEVLQRVVLVIGVIAADPTEAEPIGRNIGADTDLVVDSGWTFLGYDVADGNTSGLSNCRYDDAEMVDLRRARGPKLNDHGLFTDIPNPLALRTRTDRRVPEHAPFVSFRQPCVT